MALTANERPRLLPSKAVEETPIGPAVTSPSAGRNLFGYGALAGAVALAFGVAAYLFLSGGDEPATPSISDAGLVNPFPNTGPLEPNRPKEGERAPDFALVDARDTTRALKLSDFRGKPVVVNWYFSDCEPCQREVPAFVKAKAALGDGVVFLGVDFLEDSGEALSLLDKFGADYPAVLDRSGSVADHYRVRAFPTTFFIDAEGVLQVIKTGEVKPDALSANLAKIGLTYSP